MGKKNKCVLKMMPQCDAGPTLGQQYNCRYFDKSDQRECCTWFTFGEFCMSWPAKKDAIENNSLQED